LDPMAFRRYLKKQRTEYAGHKTKKNDLIVLHWILSFSSLCQVNLNESMGTRIGSGEYIPKSQQKRRVIIY